MMTMKIEDAGVRKALRWALGYVLAVLVLGGGIGGCVRSHREKMPLRGELQVKDGTKVLLFVPFLRELGAIDSAEVRGGRCCGSCAPALCKRLRWAYALCDSF